MFGLYSGTSLMRRRLHSLSFFFVLHRIPSPPCAVFLAIMAEKSALRARRAPPCAVRCNQSKSRHLSGDAARCPGACHDASAPFLEACRVAGVGDAVDRRVLLEPSRSSSSFGSAGACPAATYGSDLAQTRSAISERRFYDPRSRTRPSCRPTCPRAQAAYVKCAEEVPLPIDAIYFAAAFMCGRLPIRLMKAGSSILGVRHKIDTLGCQGASAFTSRSPAAQGRIQRRTHGRQVLQKTNG